MSSRDVEHLNHARTTKLLTAYFVVERISIVLLDKNPTRSKVGFLSFVFYGMGVL